MPNWNTFLTFPPDIIIGIGQFRNSILPFVFVLTNKLTLVSNSNTNSIKLIFVSNSSNSSNLNSPLCQTHQQQQGKSCRLARVGGAAAKKLHLQRYFDIITFSNNMTMTYHKRSFIAWKVKSSPSNVQLFQTTSDAPLPPLQHQWFWRDLFYNRSLHLS